MAKFKTNAKKFKNTHTHVGLFRSILKLKFFKVRLLRCFLLSKRGSAWKIFPGLLMYKHKHKYYILKLFRETPRRKKLSLTERLVKFGTIIDNLTLGK